MSSTAAVLNPFGIGYRRKNKYLWLTAATAVSRGQLVQIGWSSGKPSTFAAPGVGNGGDQTSGTYTDTALTLSKTGAFASIPHNTNQVGTVTGATYTDATKTLTKTSAFTNYAFTAAVAAGYPGDKVVVTAGTGATLGVYTVASRTSADAITLVTSIGAGADGQTNIGFSFGTADFKRRINIVSGTGVTAGVVTVQAKISDDLVVIDRDIGSTASDVAFNLLDNELMHGWFGVATRDYASGAVNCRIQVAGVCDMYTKSSASGGGAAIAAGNLYCPSTDKSGDTNATAYGVNAKFVARAIGTGTSGATNTAALRMVELDGIDGFGGRYMGAT